ncbi:MAG TPA: hypothetical protein VFB00_08340 [Terriglobales bacterium]|nr:hypothetical protein [Terriglobales bacterium]
MDRRSLLKAALAAAGTKSALAQGFGNQKFSSPIFSRDRLEQGPFDIDQDEGWLTALFTTPSEKPIRNPGLGLVGYAWEEGGPSLAARAGQETLEQHVEKISGLPFVDVLYIRCDWRNVQSRPGRLDLDPVWGLTLDAAKRRELRVAFRVQLSSPVFQPEQISLPEFLRSRVPLVKIGRIPGRGEAEYLEPRYDHPEFQKAFRELNDLLAAQFDGNPLVEWVDVMQYGFWGEGHTSHFPNPFPDYSTAERTFVEMTELQIETWKKTPLAFNTQPDISNVGNRRTLAMAMSAGAWLRSDSIIVEEPIQIDQMANRPPWLAAILEDGYFRQYDVSKLTKDASGVNVLENYMLHTQDLRANYWSLWTEASNLARYNRDYPRGFERLHANLGYRLRPSWVWQRKRHGTAELIIAVSNRGVAGVPGVLWLQLATPDRKLKLRGTLDAGHPAGGGIRLASFFLPPGFAGQINLSAELEVRPDVLKPVTWACEQPLNPDGSITIEVKTNADRGWRKGV